MTQSAITRKSDIRLGDTLGARLKSARNERNLSINKLAIALEVDPRTVARWQSDESMPSVVRLGHIARVLDKPVSYFLDGQDVAA